MNEIEIDQKKIKLPILVAILRMPAFVILVLALSHSALAIPIKIKKGPNGSGQMYVACQFENVFTSCLLDTGATESVISNAPEFDNKISTQHMTTMSASGAIATTRKIDLADIIIGPLTLKSFKIGHIPATTNRPTILGMDILSTTSFSIESNRQQQFSLSFGKRFRSNRMYPLVDLPHNLLALQVASDNKTSVALFDSGAGITVIDEKLLLVDPKNYLFVSDTQNGRDTFGNPIKTKLYKIRKLQIGKLVFKNVSALVMNMVAIQKHIDSQIEMIIGFNVIQNANWLFDPPNNTWSIE